jgi:hypothetical protein
MKTLIVKVSNYKYDYNACKAQEISLVFKMVFSFIITISGNNKEKNWMK